MIRFQENRYQFLFWGLLLCLSTFMLLQSSDFSHGFDSLLFLFVVVFTLLGLDKGSWARKLGFTVIGLEVVFAVLQQVFEDGYSNSLGSLLAFVVLVLAVRDLIVRLIRAERVTPDLLFGALAGFLLMGLVLALVIFMMDQLTNVPLYARNGIPLEQNRAFLYYTFITYTTIGYGDILPIHPASQMMAVWTGVIGQIFNTVIIALLVGKHLAMRAKN